MSNTTSTPTRFIFFSLAFLALFAALAAFMPDMALAVLRDEKAACCRDK